MADTTFPVNLRNMDRDTLRAWAKDVAQQGNFIKYGFAVSDGGGLNASIAAGLGVTEGLYLKRTTATTLGLTASATNYVFLTVDETAIDTVSITANVTNTPPSTPYLRLAIVVTGAATITSISDIRNFVGMPASLSYYVHTENIQEIKCSVAPDGTIFAAFYGATMSNGLLRYLKSTDGGVTWTNGTIVTLTGSDTFNSQFLSVKAFDANTFYVTWTKRNSGGTTYTALFSKTTDGGSNWASPVTIRASATQITGALMSAPSSSVVWIMPNDANSTLYKSTDSGATFAATAGTPAAGAAVVGSRQDLCALDATTAFIGYLTSTNPNQFTVLKTTNGGTSYGAGVVVGPDHGYLVAISSTVVWAIVHNNGTGGSAVNAWYSSDAGVTWESVQSFTVSSQNDVDTMDTSQNAKDYADSRFFAIYKDHSGLNVAATYDGISWHRVATLPRVQSSKASISATSDGSAVYVFTAQNKRLTMVKALCRPA